MASPDSEELSQRAIQARNRANRDKQQRLEEAIKELERLQQARAASEKNQVRISETDPEARVMKQADGAVLHPVTTCKFLPTPPTESSWELISLKPATIAINW